MTVKKSYCIAVIIFISFVLQYNFLFSAEFLWVNYWSGSGIRTSISFFSIFLCFVAYSLWLNLKLKLWSITIVLILYSVYGFTIGLLNNEPSPGMVAEGIFWLEIALYFIIFQNLDRHCFAVFIRAVLIYSALNGVLSIFYFWIIKDQIVVAALVSGERIVRLADLLSPLLILLFLLYNRFYAEKRLSSLFVIPLIALVMLGMFRSVWAAFVIAYVISNIVYPSVTELRRMFFILLFGLISILIFEQAYEYLFNVDGVILGRITAGIGTADSLGRVSAAKDVLYQFFENPFYILFGAGFGKLVWFVNDFGDGEVFALQPLGSLSNYYVVLLFQVGLFVFLSFVMYAIYSFFWIKRRYKKTDARLLTFVGLYLFTQWLTFPTSIHYPVALIVGIYLTLAANTTPLSSIIARN